MMQKPLKSQFIQTLHTQAFSSKVKNYASGMLKIYTISLHLIMVERAVSKYMLNFKRNSSQDFSYTVTGNIKLLEMLNSSVFYTFD